MADGLKQMGDGGWAKNRWEMGDGDGLKTDGGWAKTDGRWGMG